MEFYLYFDEWELIRKNIPVDSRASDCLQRAEVIATEDAVQPDLKICCDEASSKLIVEIAERWCPDVLPRIKMGFTAD
jgi:hypothetical protein